MQIVTTQFTNLPSMMRYLKAIKPTQFCVYHHRDEFDEEGIYEMSHPATVIQLGDEDGEGEE